MSKSNPKLDKNGKPVTGYAAFVAHEWSEINKTRTEKVTRTKFIDISKRLGRKWGKMSRAAKSKFSRPESNDPSFLGTKEKVKIEEKASHLQSASSANEGEDIINRLNELTIEIQDISVEKEKLTNQIKKIEIEKKKVAYERAQLEFEKEELTNQLREFTKIASEEELPKNDPGSESTLFNIKPNLHVWSEEEFVEDFDEIYVE